MVFTTENREVSDIFQRSGIEAFLSILDSVKLHMLCIGNLEEKEEKMRESPDVFISVDESP